MKKKTYRCGEQRYQDAIAMANYILKSQSTIRETAHVFKCSKSRVFELMQNCLKKENPALFIEVKQVFALNKAERHIRGGNSTKQKWSQKK